MKNTSLIFLLLLMCNLSFSQENTEKSNLKKTDIFKFHPNPAEDELYILGTHKIKTIEFFNVLGKRVAFYHYNKSIIKIDISNLRRGIYIIQAIDEHNKQETKKLIVK